MANKPTVDIVISGDAKALERATKKAAGDLQKLGKKTESFSNDFKKAFKFTAIASSLAIVARSLTDAAQAAAEDSRSMALLSTQLENSANATKTQIAAAEDYISKASVMAAVTDDELRPAFAQIAAVTKDVTKATDLTTLALDLAAAKGVSVEVAAKAVSKAYSGQTTALTRLAPELKGSKDLWGDLSKSVDGAAEAAGNADPFARLKIVTDELKESLGRGLLPIFNAISQWVTDNRETLTKIFEIVGQAVATLLPILTPLLNLFLMLLEPIAELVNNLMPYLSQVIGIVIEVVTPLIGVVLQLAQVFIQALLPIIPVVIQFLQLLADVIIKYIVPYIGFLASIISALAGPMANLAGIIYNSLYWALDNLIKILGPVFDLLKPVLESILAIMGIKPITIDVSTSVDTTATDQFNFDPTTLGAGIIPPTAPGGPQGETDAEKAANRRAEQIKKAAETIKAAYESAKERVKNAATGFRDAVSLGDAVTETGPGRFKARSSSVMKRMRNLIAGAKDFAANIKKLKKGGADNALIQELVDMGPGAGAAAAKELLTSGNLKEFMNLRTQLTSIGRAVGESANVAITGMTSRQWGQANTAVQGMVNSNNNTYNINLNNANLSGADIVASIRRYERQTGRKVITA